LERQEEGLEGAMINKRPSRNAFRTGRVRSTSPIRANLPGLRAVMLAAIIFSAAHAQISGPITRYIQAENFSAKQGGLFVQAIGSQAFDVHNLGNGNWLCKKLSGTDYLF
jgi:hypothetical protein